MSGGAISGSLFLGKCLFNEPIAKELIISKEFEAEKIKKIKTLDDIEIFEKQNSCYFAFSNQQHSEKAYTARKYLEQNKEKTKIDRLVFAADKFKNECKNKKIVNLFQNKKNQFKLNKNIFREASAKK